MTSATTAITIGIAAASAAAAAVSSVQQGKAQAAQAKYQAAVAKNNQTIAQQNADDALKRGDIAAEEQRKKNNLLLGQQRNDLAAQGGDINSGTALDLQLDTVATGKLDELTIRNNAQREARNFLIQGSNSAAEADLYGMAGSSALTSGYLGAGQSILSGASSVGDKWAKFKDPGTRGGPTYAPGRVSPLSGLGERRG